MIKKDKIPNQPFSDFDSVLAQEEQSVVKFEEAFIVNVLVIDVGGTHVATCDDAFAKLHEQTHKSK